MLFLLLCFPAFSPTQTPAPSPTEVQQPQLPAPKEAAKRLRDTLKAKDDAASIAALKELGTLADPLITKEVNKALKFQSPEVMVAALEALRFNPDPSALKYLTQARKNKELHKNTQLAVAYAYALGQKASPKCIPALTDNLNATSGVPAEVLKAKISALGRIRDKDAVEAIMDYCNTTRRGGRNVGGINNIMREAQRSLFILTGVDQGSSLEAWKDWWYDARKTIKISKEPWPLENPKIQRQWEQLWMSPAEKEAAKRAEKEKKQRQKEQP